MRCCTALESDHCMQNIWTFIYTVCMSYILTRKGNKLHDCHVHLLDFWVKFFSTVLIFIREQFDLIVN